MSKYDKWNNWKSVLKADPTDWLLEEDNPSVRYFTLVDLLGKSQNNAEVITARKSIMTNGPVPAILEKQETDGHWGISQDFYVRAKYKGTVWNIITLAELGADGNDERIHRAGEFILNHSQDRQSGGFAYASDNNGGGDPTRVIPCLTGNMVFSLIWFGFLEDPRVQQAIDWIVKYQRFDDGEGVAPKGWLYDRYKQCWGKHTCTMGVVKTLKALTGIPPEKRSEAVSKTIEHGAEYLLKHHLFKQSHNPALVAKGKWVRFGFLLMWETDALEMLGILTKLGYHDTRMQDAIDLVISKQDETGRWLLEKTFNDRTLVRIERKGQPSKWVTLSALRALKNWYNR
jgi:hypothetical protein